MILGTQWSIVLMLILFLPDLLVGLLPVWLKGSEGLIF